jgi:hypothetical protein
MLYSHIIIFLFYDRKREHELFHFCSKLLGKSAQTSLEAFQSFLREITGVTTSIAETIVKKYPTLRSLHIQYQQCSLDAGELLLGPLQVNKDQ